MSPGRKLGGGRGSQVLHTCEMRQVSESLSLEGRGQLSPTARKTVISKAYVSLLAWEETILTGPSQGFMTAQGSAARGS